MKNIGMKRGFKRKIWIFVCKQRGNKGENLYLDICIC